MDAGEVEERESEPAPSSVEAPQRIEPAKNTPGTDESMPTAASSDEPSLWDLARAVLRAGPEGLRAWNYRRDRDDRRPNLDGLDLSDADLSGVNLGFCSLRGADLRGARLDGAKLDSSNLENANLTEANLRSCSARAARLNGAILWGADLDDVDLTGASLTGAQLQCAKLPKARLLNATLEHADLRWAALVDADMRGANLADALLDPCDFSGAVLTGAQLPAAVVSEFDKAIERVEMAGGHPRAMFAALVGLCLFSTLAAAAVSSISLIANQGSIKLPLANTNVTAVSFFFLAPLLALGLLYYLVVHIRQITPRTAALPECLPDGSTAASRISPWLQAVTTKATTQPSTASQRWLAAITRWIVPWTATAMLWALVRCRNEWILWLHLALVGALWCAALAIWRDEHGSRRARRVARVAVASVLLLSAATILFVTYPRPLPVPGTTREHSQTGIRFQTPLPLFARGKSLQGDLLEHIALGGSDFSAASFKGAAMSGVDLRGALLLSADMSELRARKVDLYAARLGQASLVDATVECADLRTAQLNRANLSGALFSQTNFRYADLTGTTMHGTRFEYADLRQANVEGADLAGARFDHVSLQDVNFDDLDLSTARFSAVDLRGANLSRAKFTAKTFASARCDKNTRWPNQAAAKAACTSNAVVRLNCYLHI